MRNFETNMSFEVYYESIKREPKIRGINKCRCDERLRKKPQRGGQVAVGIKEQPPAAEEYHPGSSVEH